MCAMALSQTDLSALDNFPKTQLTVLEMCNRTAMKLTEVQRHQIRKLCLEFPEIWNTGARALATTNLTTFRLDLIEGAAPTAEAPRMVSPANRERIAKAVQKEVDAGIYEPSGSEWASGVVLVPRQTPQTIDCA